MSHVSVRRALILGVFLMVLSALYLVPLGFYSPCIKETGALGPPPALIGHRGAPMVRNPQMKETLRHESASVWKTINAVGELLGLLTFSFVKFKICFSEENKTKSFRVPGCTRHMRSSYNSRGQKRTTKK